MVFDSGTWWLIGVLVVALTGGLAALIDRAFFGKLREHTEAIEKNVSAIDKIQREYTPRADHSEDMKYLRDELKREIKDVREELRDENRKLAEDIKDIKENCARKDDMLRSFTGFERKLDKVLEYQMSTNGRD